MQWQQRRTHPRAERQLDEGLSTQHAPYHLRMEPNVLPLPQSHGVIWVDRHLHKNGGSTIREVMLRNEESGHCVYYGYTQTREGWARLVRYLMHGNSSAHRLPALCIEAHASQASAEFVSHRVPHLEKLRALYAKRQLPVRVVLTTRVREPLSYYLSFYRWRVAGMQRHGNVITLSRTRAVVNPIGSSFLEWAPRNLQSIGLLHGDVGALPTAQSRPAATQPHCSAAHWKRAPCLLTAVHCTRCRWSSLQGSRRVDTPECGPRHEGRIPTGWHIRSSRNAIIGSSSGCSATPLTSSPRWRRLMRHCCSRQMQPACHPSR